VSVLAAMVMLQQFRFNHLVSIIATGATEGVAGGHKEAINPNPRRKMCAANFCCILAIGACSIWCFGHDCSPILPAQNFGSFDSFLMQLVQLSYASALAIMA